MRRSSAHRVATIHTLPANPIKMEISGCRNMGRTVCILSRDGGTEKEGETGIVYKGGKSGVEVSGPPPFSYFPHLTLLIHPSKTRLQWTIRSSTARPHLSAAVISDP